MTRSRVRRKSRFNLAPSLLLRRIPGHPPRPQVIARVPSGLNGNLSSDLDGPSNLEADIFTFREAGTWQRPHCAHHHARRRRCPEQFPQNKAVALKLASFWAHQPRVWFAQAEAQFTLRGITVDCTKYSYLIAALPEDVAI